MIRSATALLQVMRELNTPRPQVHRRLEERLRRILINAYANVPYYRETMKSAGYNPVDNYAGSSDLARLPILTKQIIRDHGTDAFLDESVDPARCVVNRTSGSTGQPMAIWRSPQSEALIQARYFRALLTNGYRFTDKVLGFRPQKQDVVEEAGVLGNFGLLRWRKVNSAISTREMVEHLLSYAPDVLYGNLIHFELMAQELERQNRTYHKLKLMVPGGEVVSEGQRQRLAEVFKAPVAVTYGSVEMGIIAFDTPHKPGLQLCEDLIHFEFVDSDGNTAIAGNRSRIIMTDLTNSVMPLIRYDHEDWVTLELPDNTDDWRRLRNIEGRQNDTFTLSDGTVYTFIIPYAIMKNHSGIRQFRIVQKEADLFQIQVVTAPDYLAENRAQLLQEFQSQSPGLMVFELVVVAELLPDPHGKLRFMVSEVEGRDAS